MLIKFHSLTQMEGLPLGAAAARAATTGLLTSLFRRPLWESWGLIVGPDLGPWKTFRDRQGAVATLLGGLVRTKSLPEAMQGVVPPMLLTLSSLQARAGV